jgi:hypothetical protein
MNNKQLNQINEDKYGNEAIKIESIKSMQSLPEEVVIRFIEAKGKLIRTEKGKLKIADKGK